MIVVKIITRPHHMHWIRCRLLLQTVAWSVCACTSVCTSVCLSVHEPRRKTAELMKMPFGWLTWVVQRNNVLDGVLIPQGAVFMGCLPHRKASGESLLCNMQNWLKHLLPTSATWALRWAVQNGEPIEMTFRSTQPCISWGWRSIRHREWWQDRGKLTIYYYSLYLSDSVGCLSRLSPKFFWEEPTQCAGVHLGKKIY